MQNEKKTNYNDLIFTTAKITKEVIIEEDIKVLNKILLEHRETEQVRTAIAHLLNDYTRQKQINEEHQKENGLLREKVKELESEIAGQVYWGSTPTKEIEKVWISKQKIKNKIEELKKQKRELGFKTYFRKKDMINDDREIVIKIQILNELLQEEDK